MTITQLCEKVNVDCAKLNSIVTARRGIYFFILGKLKTFHRTLDREQPYMLKCKRFHYENDAEGVGICQTDC